MVTFRLFYMPKRQGMCCRIVLSPISSQLITLQRVELEACVCVYVTSTMCFAFVLCSHRKFITLRILDRDEYEKECSFFLVLEEPIWLRRRKKGVRVKPDNSQETKAFLCLSLFPPRTSFCLLLSCHLLCQA